jgi:hypothetical protein
VNPVYPSGTDAIGTDMQKTKADELQQLERGLAGASLRDVVGKLASENKAEDLCGKGVYYVRRSGYTMAIAGIYFLAMKEKMGHGPFKKSFRNAPVSYMTAWTCMKAARVVSEHPVFGELRSSRAFRELLLLPAPDRKALADAMENIPEGQIGEFLPEKIQKRYAQLKSHRTESESESKHRPLPGRSIPAEDREWSEIWSLYVKAFSAMSLLAKKLESTEIKPAWFDQIFEQKMVREIGKFHEVMIEKFHPIEEVTKRAEIRHVPGFAKE